MDESLDFSASCPIPISGHSRVQLAHGGGGNLMHQLVEQMFLKTFGPAHLSPPHDSATFNLPPCRVAFTTDSYVVRPLIFPGGDIGSLSVFGTVNDLAMSGARPLFLSCGFIIEEGLPMEELWRIVLSMRAAADRCGVQIVTGDTKVVDKGKGDGLFINTSGIGVIEHSQTISPDRVREGDAILLSGDVGRHGMTIMSVREGLGFEATLESDSAPISDEVLSLLEAGVEIHCLRDLTRGGLASALNEISQASKLRFCIDEQLVPLRQDVRAACELLGLDPLLVACEGRFVAFVPKKDAPRALDVLNARSKEAVAFSIGDVCNQSPPLVVLNTALGSRRILDMPSGDQLPRIC